MTESNTFLLAMEALTELAPEIEAAKTNQASAVPSLMDALSTIPQVPREALFLGVAYDGLPVLLNLDDPVPGPLLVTGDEACGKTAFLRMAAKAISDLHSKNEVRFGVITPNPEEWKGFKDIEHCTGVFPVYQRSAKDHIFAMGEWAHTSKTLQSTVLLIDDFHRILDLDSEVKDTLRWLLLRGPSRHVWTIATLKSSQIAQVEPWLDYFRTRIYGRLENTSQADFIADCPTSGLDTLTPGVQFAMREGFDMLRFWTPRLED